MGVHVVDRPTPVSRDISKGRRVVDRYPRWLHRGGRVSALHLMKSKDVEDYAGGVPDERPHGTGLLRAMRHTLRG